MSRCAILGVICMRETNTVHKKHYCMGFVEALWCSNYMLCICRFLVLLYIYFYGLDSYVLVVGIFISAQPHLNVVSGGLWQLLGGLFKEQLAPSRCGTMAIAGVILHHRCWGSS